MKVSVKYFAALRELFDESEAIMDIEENMTVEALWEAIVKQKAATWHTMPMISVNHHYVHAGHRLQADDEVAFFPPVTGG